MRKTTRLILVLAGTAVLLKVAGASGSDGAASFDQAPVVIYQEPPVYPESLRHTGTRGEVVVDFTVDTEGNVGAADVSRSPHPDFEAPAVEAVLKWKFRPGMKDGHPVAVRISTPIIFDLRTDGQADTINLHRLGTREGVEPWKMADRSTKGTSPEFQFDEAPKPILTSAPVYPYDLLVQGVKGKAAVSFKIDPQGRPRSVVALSATDPEFAAATTAMIEAWRFEPAKKAGKPCWSYLRKDQEFEISAGEFPLSESAARLLGVLKKDRSKIVKDCRLLDSTPRGRFTPSPAVPESVRNANVEARAVVEFVLDHDGHAQLPRVISATNADFGWTSATAVARWQYTIPSKNGKPVDVFVRVPLVYSPPNPPAKGS
jgi:TonB family protein